MQQTKLFSLFLIAVCHRASWFHRLFGFWPPLHRLDHFWRIDNVLLSLLLQKMWRKKRANAKASEITMEIRVMSWIVHHYNSHFVS